MPALRLMASTRVCVAVLALLRCQALAARVITNDTRTDIQQQVYNARQPSEVIQTADVQKEVKALFEQIELDFEPFLSTKITSLMVEQAYCACSSAGFRFQVVDNQLYVAGETRHIQSRHAHLKKQLLDLYRADGNLPDVDIVFGSSDFSEECSISDMPPDCRARGPRFHHTKTAEQNWTILHPDETFGGWPEANINPWAEQQQVLSMAASAHSWADRSDALFFAGANLGYTRMNAAKFFAESAHPEVELKWVNWAKPHTLMGQHDFCKYRYLLHMAGCSWSSRLKWIMLCRAAIVFSQSPFLEFWHRALEPGRNIISVPEVEKPKDSLHILKAAQKLRSDDGFAQKLAAAAQATALHTLSPENVREYWRRLLHTYSALQTFKPVVHKDAVPFHISLTFPQYVMSDQRSCSVCPHSTTNHQEPHCPSSIE